MPFSSGCLLSERHLKRTIDQGTRSRGDQQDAFHPSLRYHITVSELWNTTRILFTPIANCTMIVSAQGDWRYNYLWIRSTVSSGKRLVRLLFRQIA